MRKLLLIVGLAALAAPGVALAQTGCPERPHDSRVAGTAARGVSDVLAPAVAGPGDDGGGVVTSMVGGVAVGAVAAGPASACDGFTRIGYDDDQGATPAGHYDSDGDWVDAAPPMAPLPPAPPPSAGDYGADVAYTGPANDLQGREAWIEQRIHEADVSGALSRGDAEHDFDVLAGIREFQARRADDNGGLSPADRADVMNKLDNLTAIVRSQRRY